MGIGLNISHSDYEQAKIEIEKTELIHYHIKLASDKHIAIDRDQKFETLFDLLDHMDNLRGGHV